MSNQNPSFRFEIDNFLEKETVIPSQTFVVGGYEWYLSVYPKGENDNLYLYLDVPNHKSLQAGWKRSALYYFVLLNQSDEELYKSPIGQASKSFCAETPGWGFRLPLSKIHEKGFLEKDTLIIEVYIQVLEADDGASEDVSENKDETHVDINAFQTFASHVRKIFAEKVQKTEYKIALSNACSKLSELAEVGSKLDWLKSKLDEISLKRKKADDVDESRVQQLEERIKGLELMESSLKMDCLKLEKISLEQKKSYEKLEERVKNFDLMESACNIEYLKSKLEEMALERKKSYEEERVKSFELMESAYKMDCLESKLEEIYLEQKKSYGELEERVKNFELMESGSKMDSLKSRLEEISLEQKKSYDVLEERFDCKNFELMVSDTNIESRLEKISLEQKKSYEVLEERVKNFELMEAGSKMDSLKSRLDEISFERMISDVSHGSRFKRLEERVKNLELMELELKLNCLKSKLDEISLERKRSDDANGSQLQQHEESIKNLELMISELKAELEKEKTKSFDDGFLIVD